MKRNKRPFIPPTTKRFDTINRFGIGQQTDDYFDGIQYQQDDNLSIPFTDKRLESTGPVIEENINDMPYGRSKVARHQVSSQQVVSQLRDRNVTVDSDINKNFNVGATRSSGREYPERVDQQVCEVEGEDLITRSKKSNDKKNFLWTDDMDEFLIDELTNQMQKGQKIGGTFTTTAYSAVVHEISEKFDVVCSSDHVKNRMRTLKKNYAMAHDILYNGSGFGYNQSTHMIEATTSVWQNLIKARPQVASLRYKPVRNYYKLDELLGRDRATGEFAAGPRERQLRWSKNNNTNDIEEQNISTEQVELDGDDVIFANEQKDPLQEASSNCKLSSTTPKEPKKKKKKQTNSTEEFQSFQETFKEGMQAVAMALDRGNLRNYDESKLFKEVEKIDNVSTKTRMKIYNYLCEDPNSARAFLACPEDSRSLWVTVKFDSVFLST